VSVGAREGWTKAKKRSRTRLTGGVLGSEAGLLFRQLVVLDAPNVGDGGGGDGQAGDADLPAHGQLAGRERVFDGTHGGFHGRAQVVAVTQVGPVGLAAFGAAYLRGGERQQVVRVAFLGLEGAGAGQVERASGAEGRVKASLPTGRAARCDRDRLSLWTGDLGGVALCVLLEVEIGQAELLRVGLCAAQGGLNVRDRLGLLHSLIAGLAAKAAVGYQRLQVAACLQVGQGFGQQLAIIHVVECGLDFADQLDFVLRVAGFGNVGHIAFVMPAAFPGTARQGRCGAVAGFQIVQRLQAARSQLAVLFGLGTIFVQVKVVGEETHQDLVGRLQFLQQGVDRLPDPLQMLLHGFFPLHPVGVMPGAVLGVGRQGFRQTHFVAFAQDPFQALHACHQQLQATETFTKVVQAVDLKVAIPQPVVAQRITHLQVVAVVFLRFLVAPAKACLQGFQPHQHIDRHIRTRIFLRIQHRKAFFLDAAEEFFVKRARPRVFQTLALFLGQFAGGTDQRLLLFGVFSEHAPTILNFRSLEEGRRPFLLWSHLRMRIRIIPAA
jgi:hypothetical protein